MEKIKHWAKKQSWSNVLNASTASKKAEILQSTLLQTLEDCLPTKTVSFSSDDSQWIYNPRNKSRYKKTKGIHKKVK